MRNRETDKQTKQKKTEKNEQHKMDRQKIEGKTAITYIFSIYIYIFKVKPVKVKDMSSTRKNI